MSNLSRETVIVPDCGINRERPEGYAVTDKNAGFAEVLFKIVKRLDAGEDASDWGCWVQHIGKAMSR